MDPAEQVPHSVPTDKETDPVTETYSVQFCRIWQWYITFGIIILLILFTL